MFYSFHRIDFPPPWFNSFLNIFFFLTLLWMGLFSQFLFLINGCLCVEAQLIFELFILCRTTLFIISNICFSKIMLCHLQVVSFTFSCLVWVIFTSSLAYFTSCCHRSGLQFKCIWTVTAVLSWGHRSQWTCLLPSPSGLLQFASILLEEFLCISSGPAFEAAAWEKNLWITWLWQPTGLASRSPTGL